MPSWIDSPSYLPDALPQGKNYPPSPRNGEWFMSPWFEPRSQEKEYLYHYKHGRVHEESEGFHEYYKQSRRKMSTRYHYLQVSARQVSCRRHEEVLRRECPMAVVWRQKTPRLESHQPCRVDTRRDGMYKTRMALTKRHVTREQGMFSVNRDSEVLPAYVWTHVTRTPVGGFCKRMWLCSDESFYLCINCEIVIFDVTLLGPKRISKQKDSLTSQQLIRMPLK